MKNQVYWKFGKILQRDGWSDEQFITTDSTGVITNISKRLECDVDHQINGMLIPGFQNAHSHSFQYAMAGLAECIGQGKEHDDFWSWRESMYHLALKINPEQLQVLATQLYSEMLDHGITQVAEFHYLHHDKDGKQFQNLAEMGERLIAAASSVGMGITLIPIFYSKGGFGRGPGPEQRRFICATVNDYKKLCEVSQLSCAHYKRAKLGLGVHSLRAASEDQIRDIVDMNTDGRPIHLHIAEQQKEVADCLEYYSKRPVRWLIDNFDVNSNFHLVHATHMDTSEVNQLAATGAGVVLCPSTEGNLGDGLFPLKTFAEAGGSYSIGSDSHIGLSPLEELRWLDYGQRLIEKKRNILCRDQGLESGELLFHQTYKTGTRAMGKTGTENYFEVGSELTGVVIKDELPLLQATSSKKILSTLIYSYGKEALKGTLVAGAWHNSVETAAFKNLLGELKNRF
ncbi:MAG: formimidoylglutamate deiminase [Halobacteriovoraceae bacterium]|nr:formimidoylglutamate deiminase [Halobacteriovoraceae bacterium]